MYSNNISYHQNYYRQGHQWLPGVKPKGRASGLSISSTQHSWPQPPPALPSPVSRGPTLAWFSSPALVAPLLSVLLGLPLPPELLMLECAKAQS